MKRNYITLSILLLVSYLGFSQEDDSESNIQTYTPSKLLDKGQADIKFFNNLYTEIEEIGNGVKSDKPRETYFTSTLDFFVGVSENNRVNLGLLLEYRSNIINGESATSVFKFGNEEGVSRNGLSSFATAIKWQPLENIGNFSIQTAFHVPFIREESSEGVFLDQTAYTIQNRFFFDHTFPGNKWQLFTELNTEYNYGNKDSFANNTFLIAPGVFMSYFPTNNPRLYCTWSRRKIPINKFIKLRNFV